MKNFLAIYLGTESSLAKWEALDKKTRDERESAGMAMWMSWAKKNEGSIVDNGSPIGKAKRIDREGLSDTQNEIAAYTVVRAESHEAAARLFLEHPHFTTFPGDCVEIMECLPMPEME